MSKEPRDKTVDRRLGRIAVFRGLAGDKAIDATAKAGTEGGGPDDHDAAPHPNDSDSDAGPRRPVATDSEKPAPRSATDSDEARPRPRDRSTD